MPLTFKKGPREFGPRYNKFLVVTDTEGNSLLYTGTDTTHYRLMRDNAIERENTTAIEGGRIDIRGSIARIDWHLISNVAELRNNIRLVLKEHYPQLQWDD